MKKILSSGAMLLAVAAVLIGGTGAFFSDTETSSGNVFTAGSIDLMINHTAQTYNGESCVRGCDTWAQNVVSFDQGTRKDGGNIPANRSNTNNVLGPANTAGGLVDVNPTGFVSLGFGGSIVLGFPQGIYDGPGDDLRIYEATGQANYPDEIITVEVSVDGLDWSSVPVSPSNITFDGTVEIDINGQAPVVYFVRITDVSDATIHPNNGDGYDLDAVEALHCIDGATNPAASDIWQCQLWASTDLTNQSFFNFSDIKPQDSGTNLISMTVESNESYLCLRVAEDELASVSGTGGGDMGDYLQVMGWYADSDGDITDNTPAFGPTAANDLGSITYADSNAAAVVPGETQYLLLEWCMGDMTVSGTDVTCDGNVPNINDTQAAEFVADLQFYAIQSRNNSDFECSDANFGDENPVINPILTPEGGVIPE